MQRVRDLTIAGVVHPVALVFSKKEIDALASAMGPKKSPADTRVLWCDFGRASATATNGSLALMLSVKDAPCTTDGWAAVPADTIAVVVKGSKAGEAIIVAGDVARVAAMRDFSDGDTVVPADLKTIEPCVTPGDVTLDADAVAGMFTKVFIVSNERSHSFSLKGSVVHVLEKIAKATGDGDVFCMMCPFDEGPMSLRVEHEFDEKTTVFDLLVQPLS